MEVTEISLVVDVLLPLGRKQQSLVHGTCGLFTLHTLLKAVVRCLQLNTKGGSDDMQILTVTRTYLDPKLSMHEVWPSYSRGMRLPNYTSSSIYSSFATLTLTTSRCL